MCFLCLGASLSGGGFQTVLNDAGGELLMEQCHPPLLVKSNQAKVKEHFSFTNEETEA